MRFALRSDTSTDYIDLYTPASTLTANTWHHVASTVSGTSAKIFVGGIQKASGTVSASRVQGLTDCRIGRLNSSSPRPLNGWVDELRVTKGVARYTGAFTVPTATFPITADETQDKFLEVNPLVPRPLKFAPTSVHIAGADLDAFGAYTLKTLGYTGADIENGGTGRIYGTTKEKPNPSLPATPFSRRVLLVDERSQLIIRQTWSDAATGTFEFRDLALGRPYTTLSYDHLRNYRATIADNQLAEPQA